MEHNEYPTRAAYCERCGYTGTFTLVGKLWRHTPANGSCGHAVALPMGYVHTGFEAGML